MSSFLVNCANCSALIPKDVICPNCQHSGDEQAGPVVDAAQSVGEFARRRKEHNVNTSVSMVVKMFAGLLGFLTACCWAAFMYRGSILGFLGIGVLTCMSGVVGVVGFSIDKWLPQELKCPGCETRLDQLGVAYDQCPCCTARLV